MTNLDFNEITNLGWKFLQEGYQGSVPKFPMPLHFIADLPLVHRGDFGKYLIQQYCVSAGLNVQHCPQKRSKPYDWLINEKRVAVKFAFESKDNEWTFNQIREPNHYDYLCCLGIRPIKNKIDGKCFVFCKDELFNHIENERFKFQHAGRKTWMWKIPSDDHPTFYSNEGTLEELITKLSDQ